MSACSPSTVVPDFSSPPTSFVGEIDNAETIEETEYFKIIRADFLYYCYIYDGNHNKVKSEGPFNKQPHILMVNDHLLRFTLQAGTGIGTQWGYFYDIKENFISQVLQSIYDQCDDKVAYGNVKKVIVSSIFNKTKYYYEISTFKEPLSEVAEPITNVEFVDDGARVKVSYLTGADFQEVTETIDLP